ncbi:MAG: PAS domain-containing protein [Rhizobiales bacterium]|nr:PAS domain-containing protein [Hyphomicrobiales bacterium]
MSHTRDDNLEIVGLHDHSGDAVQRAYLWTGEFASKSLEDSYAQNARQDTKNRLLTVQLGALSFLIWACFDYITLGTSPLFWALLAGRILTVVVLVYGIWRFSLGSSRDNLFAWITLTQALICIISPISLAAGHIDFATSVLSTLVITFVYYVVVPNRLVPNLILSITLCLGLVAIMPGFEGISLKTMIEVTFLFIIINAIGCQVIRGANRLRRSNYLTMLRQSELFEQLRCEMEVREEAELAVRSTEESFQSIFYAAPMPIALIDRVTLKVIQANPAAISLLGVEDEELTEIDVTDLFTDTAALLEIQKRLDENTMEGPFEICLTTRDDESIWVNISVARVQFARRPAALVGMQDVTAKHREAEALREARDEATAASRSKSEFLANMSHELRTPLNAIIGFSETIEREMFGPVGNARYREYAEDIHNSGVHLLNLINDILDLSKIEAGHFILHPEQVEVGTITNGACRIVQHRAAQSRIDVCQEIDAPDMPLIVDERAMKQVLINLLSNAVKFSPDGSVVTLKVERRSDGARLSVIDRGVGIAQDDIPRALAPFTQLDGSLSRMHEGTGLGLPLAKHLVELHGGTLTIDSVVGAGTAVHIDLPKSCMVETPPLTEQRNGMSA